MRNKVVKTNRDVDELLNAIFSGKIRPCQLKFGGCKCGGGLRSNPSPNWMNRFTCEKCGKHTSR